MDDEAPESLVDTVRDALVRKGAEGQFPCPVCTANRWRIADRPLMLRAIAEPGVLLGPADLPTGAEVAAVFCDACGFVRLHVLDSLLKD
jgi:hypothetical protein